VTEAFGFSFVIFFYRPIRVSEHPHTRRIVHSAGIYSTAARISGRLESFLERAALVSVLIIFVCFSPQLAVSS
jgi:hypothetical protein